MQWRHPWSMNTVWVFSACINFRDQSWANLSAGGFCHIKLWKNWLSLSLVLEILKTSDQAYLTFWFISNSLKLKFYNNERHKRFTFHPYSSNTYEIQTSNLKETENKKYKLLFNFSSYLRGTNSSASCIIIQSLCIYQWRLKTPNHTHGLISKRWSLYRLLLYTILYNQLLIISATTD